MQLLAGLSFVGLAASAAILAPRAVTRGATTLVFKEVNGVAGEYQYPGARQQTQSSTRTMKEREKASRTTNLQISSYKIATKKGTSRGLTM
jgi:hypothetical protein